jgi:sugar phosphate permease
VVGLIILTLGTIPFAFIGADSSYTLLAGLLVVRGFGIGSSMMPSMAAAYATLQREAVPRATSSLNALQRIGGSIGTAVLAVVLQGQIKDQLAAAQIGQSAPAASGTLERLPEALRAKLATPLADAFASTFWWAVGISVLAIVPATVLAMTQRRAKREAAAAEPEPEPDGLMEPERLPA